MSNCRVENGQDRGSKSSIWSLSWAQYVDICTERCGKWPDHWLTMRQNNWRHAADWTRPSEPAWKSLPSTSLVPRLPVIDMIENHTSCWKIESRWDQQFHLWHVFFSRWCLRRAFSDPNSQVVLDCSSRRFLEAIFPQKSRFRRRKPSKEWAYL